MRRYLGFFLILFTCFATYKTPMVFASGPIWEQGGTKCMPNFRNDVPVGYLCVKVEPGSVYARTGLQKGDNVVAINGKAMNGTVEESIDLWKDFEKMNSSTLLVERGDKKVTLNKASAKPSP